MNIQQYKNTKKEEEKRGKSIQQYKNTKKRAEKKGEKERS
jgi:hypothetical protein